MENTCESFCNITFYYPLTWMFRSTSWSIKKMASALQNCASLKEFHQNQTLKFWQLTTVLKDSLKNILEE